MQNKQRLPVPFMTRIIAGSISRIMLLSVGVIFPLVLVILIMTSNADNKEYAPIIYPLVTLLLSFFIFLIVYFRCGIFVSDEGLSEQRLLRKANVIKWSELRGLSFAAMDTVRYTLISVGIVTYSGYEELITVSRISTLGNRKKRYRFARELAEGIKKHNKNISIEAPEYPADDTDNDFDRVSYITWGGVKEYINSTDASPAVPKLPWRYFFKFWKPKV